MINFYNKIVKIDYDQKFFGLIGVPFFENDADNFADSFGSHPSYYPSAQVTTKNHQLIKNFLIKNINSVFSIMEIGVYGNGDQSFTKIFFDYKNSNCKYIGIDIQDKSFLNSNEKLIFTLQTDSSEQIIVRNYLNTLNIKEIDLLFIDNGHSINQVINDWKYADLLSNNGTIVLHDTNTHPGPFCILECIDKKIFNIKKYFEDDFYDYGITIVNKIN